MMEKKELRPGRPVVESTVSGAVEKILIDAADAGVTLDDIKEEPKVRGEAKESQENLDKLVELKARGSAVPGQSLTNSPEQPYPWEQPAEFANPREAIDSVLAKLLQPEAAKEIINALSEGASVGDLAMSITYSQFVEGKITPDSMMLMVEPLMYLIMGIGDEANVKYNIDNDDIDEGDEEEIKSKLQEFNNIFEQIKSGAMSKEIEPEKAEVVVEKSLLNKVKEAGPEIRQSLLAREENNE